MLSRSAIVPPRHRAVKLSSSGAIEPSTVALSNCRAVEPPSCRGIEPPSCRAGEPSTGWSDPPANIAQDKHLRSRPRDYHHAAHGMRDRQGLPALFGLAAEENFQGKTGQCGSAANFLPAQERQHKKKAAIAHGVHGGRRDHQGSPVFPASI